LSNTFSFTDFCPGDNESRDEVIRAIITVDRMILAACFGKDQQYADAKSKLLHAWFK